MKDILGTLTLASLAHALSVPKDNWPPKPFGPKDTWPPKGTWPPMGMGKLPMDEDKNGMMGGFSDEPMEFPPFDMGSMPSKGPGFMGGMDMPPMGDGTDGMPGPLDMVKMKITEIEDVEDVKVSFKS